LEFASEIEMIKKLSDFFVGMVERWIPDPLVIAALLTALVLVLSVTVADFGFLQTIEAWGGSFWSLLRFTGQMILILVFGHALAGTAPIRRLLQSAAERINTARSAYIIVCFVTALTALFSWGLALVVGAIFARTVAESLKAKAVTVHYSLLVASSYAGFVIWHQGLSGSIPLVVNTPGHFLEGTIGMIPVAATIFSPINMAVAFLVLLTLPFVMASQAPSIADCNPLPDHLDSDRSDRLSIDSGQGIEGAIHSKDSPAERLENARGLNVFLVLLGLAYLGLFFIRDGGSLNLDILNFIFLLAGLALSKSPKDYLELLTAAARVIGPFLIQYPLYAGLMGVMAASGLGAMLVDFFVSIASAETLPIFSFFSAGILNIFIPSGGGQWAVQGPIVVNAALALGADLPRVVMAVAWGDQWTNMIQPLFAIPLLAIAGLHIRDIMGYCVIALLYTGVVFVAALALF
jgi:short-chain fatty acids transporter